MRPDNASPWAKRLWQLGPPVVLAVVFLIITRDLLLGRAIVAWDGDEFFTPYYTLLADYIRSGQLLLWNPWNAGGIPDFVEPQVGAVSPVHLLFAALTGGSWVGFRLFHLAVMLFGGIAMYVLGRRLRAPRWGCLVVSLGFAFSGFPIGHSEHLSFMYSFAWLPLQLVLLDRALEKRSYLGAAQAGVACGLSLLGGYPPITFNNAALCGFWAVGRVFVPAHPVDDTGPAARLALRARALDAVKMMTVMGAVGFLVMSPVLIGLQIEAAGFSGRVGHLSRELVVGSNYLGPRALLTIFSSYFAQLPPSALWPATDPSSVNVYGGSVVLTLALWALIGQPRRPARWGLLAVAVGAALLAVGQTLPFRGWLYDVMPPTRFFRHPAIYRAYIILGIAVLALVGTRDLDQVPNRRWPLLAAALLGATGALWSFIDLTALASNGALAHGQRDTALIWEAIVIASVFFVFVRRRQALALLMGAVVALAIADAASTKARSVTLLTKDPDLVAFWGLLDKLHKPSLALTGELARLPVIDPTTGFGPGRSNRNFLVKTPGLLAYAALANSFHDRWSRHPVLSQAASGADRIWFAHDVVKTAPSEDAFVAFVQRTDVLKAIPLVVHTREEMTAKNASTAPSPAAAAALASTPAAQRIPTRLLTYDVRTLALEVDAPQDGWLLVTDRWAPGWKAWVNGTPTPVFGGDFIFRAVPVPAGKVEVRFHYEPATVPWLILLSWGTIAAVLITTVAIARTRSRLSRAPRADARST